MRQADIIVYGRDGSIQLVVEVKSRRGVSEQWAAQMRSSLLEYGALPVAPHFLLAMPDFFFLWSRAAWGEALPDFTVDARKALGPYLHGLEGSWDRISEPGLELVVSSWLQDLAASNLRRETARPGLEWVFDSGLYEAIKGGSVAIEVAV